MSNKLDTYYLHIKKQPLSQLPQVAKELFEILMQGVSGTLISTNWWPKVVLDEYPDVAVAIKYSWYHNDFLYLEWKQITGHIEFDYSFSKTDESIEEPWNNSAKDWLTFTFQWKTWDEIQDSKYFHWVVDRDHKKVPRNHTFTPLNLNPHFIVDRKWIPKK